MEIKTKFAIDDTVYIMEDNIPVKAKIESTIIEQDKSEINISYRLLFDDDHCWMDDFQATWQENKIYSSLNEVMNDYEKLYKSTIEKFHKLS